MMYGHDQSGSGVNRHVAQYTLTAKAYAFWNLIKGRVDMPNEFELTGSAHHRLHYKATRAGCVIQRNE